MITLALFTLRLSEDFWFIRVNTSSCLPPYVCTYRPNFGSSRECMVTIVLDQAKFQTDSCCCCKSTGLVVTKNERIQIVWVSHSNRMTNLKTACTGVLQVGLSHAKCEEAVCMYVSPVLPHQHITTLKMLIVQIHP